MVDGGCGLVVGQMMVVVVEEIRRSYLTTFIVPLTAFIVHLVTLLFFFNHIS